MEQLTKKRLGISYRKVWEAKVPWVQGVNDDPHKAFCSVCCRTLLIGYGGFRDLTRHEKTSAHRKAELSKGENDAGTLVMSSSTSEIAAEADSTVESNGTRQDSVDRKRHLDRTREETTTKNVVGEKVSDLPTVVGACQYDGVSHIPSQGVPDSRSNKLQTSRARNICPPLKDLSSSLRMWVPPLRLLSASIWQVVQQRQVQSYYRVEEFVSVVLELVPDLLSTEEKIELLLGLRTTFALDSCHHAPYITVKMMLPHLDRVSRIAEIASSDGYMSQTADAAVKEFKEVIQGLLKSPAYRRRFFQEIYPLRYGPSYDAALQLLVWEFLSRLEVLLPVPSFHEAASFFDEDPLLLEEFLQMGDDLQPIQELLLHKKHFLCPLSGSSPPTKTNTVLSTSSDSPIVQPVLTAFDYPIVQPVLTASDSPIVQAVLTASDSAIVQAVLTASEQPDKCLSASREPQSSQNRPDLFGVSIDENCSADVNGGDTDTQRDSDEVLSDASQHDQPGDTQQSSQTSNGESSSPYIVVNWRGDDDDDDDDIDDDDIDDDDGDDDDGDDFDDDGDDIDDEGDDDDDDYDDEGDSQRDSDEGVSDTSYHDQQGDVQRTSQRTLNEEKQKEINGYMNAGERTVKILNEGKDQPSTAVSAVIPDNNNVGLSLPSEHDKVSPKLDLEKNTNDHTKENHVVVKQSANGPSHPCSICSKIFTRKHDLKRHHAIHRGEKVSLKVSLKVDLEKNTNVLTKDSLVASKMSANGPPHPCPLCGKTYSRKHDLERHHRIHTGEKPYVCCHCGERFRLNDSLTRHARTHTGERPFECSSCGEKFIRNSQLVRHLKLHTDCRIECERMVNNRSEESESPSTEGSLPSTQQATLQKVPAHSNKQVGKSSRKYPCLECDKVFTSSYHLKRHQTLHTGLRPHACPHCGKTFLQKAGLAKHISIHTGNRPFECQSCKKKFRRDQALVNHLVRHTDCMTDCERMINDQSEDKDPPYTEPSLLSTLQATLHKAHKAPKYPCSSCGKVCFRPSEFADHQKIHTGERPHLCSYCGKTFRTKFILQMHIRTHTGHRPYECSVCGKRFSQQSQLIVHKRLHTGEKPYLCSFCGKDFYHLGAFYSHTRTHTGERPHQCEFCNKKFSKSGTLNIHRRIHTKERPFLCTLCPKRFPSTSGLKKHVRTHTGEKPYTCLKCGKTFSETGNLKVHQRVHR